MPGKLILEREDGERVEFSEVELERLQLAVASEGFAVHGGNKPRHFRELAREHTFHALWFTAAGINSLCDGLPLAYRAGGFLTAIAMPFCLHGLQHLVTRAGRR